MSSGVFVVLEGIEGSGKSTQHRRLVEWMEELGVAHVATREPGGTELGEKLRRLLLDARHDGMSPETELFLILAARSTFVRAVVEPALERGEVVLADRYELSTLAYQGYGRGLDLDAVRRANRLATGGRVPDLCVVLDLDVEEGLARQRRQGKEEDRIEASGLAFFREVRRGYRELAAESDAVRVLDATEPADRTQERIRNLLRERFPETFSRG